MESQDRIRTALERNVRALERRSDLGRGTARTVVRVEEGLRCTIREGPFDLVADMTPKYGGTDGGPNPGVYGRAALGSCLAVGYMMFASRAGLEIDALEVEVEVEYDVRPELGMSDEQPGYDEVRYRVTVESPAPPDEVLAVLDETDRHSPWLAVFRRPQKVVRDVEVRGRGAGRQAAEASVSADPGS